MAEDREPPPMFEENHNHEAEEDLFVSAIDIHPPMKVEENENKKPLQDLMAGGGEEVSLDDDEQNGPNETTKLEFCTPEEEVEKPLSKVESNVPIVAPRAVPSSPAEIKTSQPSQSKVQSGKTIDEAEDESSDQFIEIKIGDPFKIGDGVSSFVSYRVTTTTNLKYFRKKTFSVNRRFSDFLGLHEKLAGKHVHLGRIVPPAPQKSVIGTTKVKMSKEDNAIQGEFIAKRRASLERYLNRTAAHPILRIDPDFREFLELDADLPHASNTSALSGAGVMRFFNRVGDTVNKITFKMDESDPWFEEKQHQIDNLDQQLQKLHSSVESLVHHRKELASSTSSFAKTAALLGSSEEHTSLSRALSQLAEVEDKIEQLQTNLANQDFFLLSELLRDYICLIGAIKGVFHQRVKVYQTWQHAQQTLTKKREQKAKLELASKTDKIEQARDEVSEWESKVERGQEEFENISKQIRKEVEAFERTRVKDFKVSIVKYMESLLEAQQQLIKYWEAFLPETKAIA